MNKNPAIKKEFFNRHCKKYGLYPEDLGKSFWMGNLLHIIIGINPSNRVYPIIVKREDGKIWKFSSELVKTKLG